MTDAKLIELYNARKTALAAFGSGKTGKQFWQFDKAIVRELLLRGKPVRLPGMVLYLTADQLNFIAVKPGTTTPVNGVAITSTNVQKMLWHYRITPVDCSAHRK